MLFIVEFINGIKPKLNPSSSIIYIVYKKERENK
jgi:hypothetical protein